MQKLTVNPADHEYYRTEGWTDFGRKVELTVLHWTVLEATDVELVAQNVEMYTIESAELFQAWCKEHNIHYYAAPHEDFNELGARNDAAQKGCKYLLLDDLS